MAPGRKNGSVDFCVYIVLFDFKLCPINDHFPGERQHWVVAIAKFSSLDVEEDYVDAKIKSGRRGALRHPDPHRTHRAVFPQWALHSLARLQSHSPKLFPIEEYSWPLDRVVCENLSVLFPVYETTLTATA